MGGSKNNVGAGWSGAFLFLAFTIFIFWLADLVFSHNSLAYPANMGFWTKAQIDIRWFLTILTAFIIAAAVIGGVAVATIRSIFSNK